MKKFRFATIASLICLILASAASALILYFNHNLELLTFIKWAVFLYVLIMLAFNAAMSFEQSKVTYYGNRYVYNNKHYSTSAEVSRAMSENSAKKINLVYYDIDNSTVEKNFSFEQ